MKIGKNVDTMTLQFKVKPYMKNFIFQNFLNGKIIGVHRKWKNKKLWKLKVQKKKLFKGKIDYYNSSYRNRNYFKPYPFTGGYDGYSINYCHYNWRDDYVLVTLQHKKIAHKDIVEIYSNVMAFLQNIGFDLEDLEITDKLNRIDYRRDYEFKNMAEFSAIVNIISKTRIASKGVVKETYNGMIDNTRYITGIRYKPKSSYGEVIVYYKSLEVNARRKKHSHTELNIELYDNVIRTELRLKNKRLNANKKNTLKIDKTLHNYSQKTIIDKSFQKYIEPIFYTEPFYRLDVALQLIQTDSRLTDKEVEKLSKLVTDINRKGFTMAKQEYNYCDDTFENHIKILRSLGINPLCFDKNIGITFLPNFTTKEVCRHYEDSNHQWKYEKKQYDEWGFEIE